jgi:hypothetical protein
MTALAKQWSGVSTPVSLATALRSGELPVPFDLPAAGLASFNFAAGNRRLPILPEMPAIQLIRGSETPNMSYSPAMPHRLVARLGLRLWSLPTYTISQSCTATPRTLDESLFRLDSRREPQQLLDPFVRPYLTPYRTRPQCRVTSPDQVMASKPLRLRLLPSPHSCHSPCSHLECDSRWS